MPYRGAVDFMLRRLFTDGARGAAFAAPGRCRRIPGRNSCFATPMPRLLERRRAIAPTEPLCFIGLHNEASHRRAIAYQVDISFATGSMISYRVSFDGLALRAGMETRRCLPRMPARPRRGRRDDSRLPSSCRATPA